MTNISQETLLPCPFCQSQALKLHDNTGPKLCTNPHAFVSCLNCFTDGPERTTPEGAGESWNTRTPTSSTGSSDIIGELVEGYRVEHHVDQQLRKRQEWWEIRTATGEYLATCADPDVAERLRAALANAKATPSPEAVREMAGWQPIETAPRDGSGILVIDSNAEAPQAGSAWFVHGFWTAVDPEGFESDVRLLRSLAWAEPTHWRPLPDPPLNPSDAQVKHG